MAKKKNNWSSNTWVIGILIVAVIVLVYFGFINKEGFGTEVKIIEVGGDFAEEGGYVDGIWDEETQQCLPPTGREGMVLARCCFERQNDGTEINVPCDDIILQQSFWLGSVRYADNAGIRYGISFRNTGTDDIDEAWVSNALYSGQDELGNPVPTPVTIMNGFGSIVGLSHVGPIAAGASNIQYGTTTTIYFGDYATSDERTYTVTLMASYLAGGGVDSGTSQGSIIFTVRKTGYDLGVDISQQ